MATHLRFLNDTVYVVLGIDAHEHDQVLGVCRTYDEAKRFCIKHLFETEFFDIWIEKHDFA